MVHPGWRTDRMLREWGAKKYALGYRVLGYYLYKDGARWIVGYRGFPTLYAALCWIRDHPAPAHPSDQEEG